MSNQLPLRILSLDGGGVRGIATLQVLSEVMAQLRRTHRATNRAPLESNRPCDYFDLICGTSTGGLIAIMLGRLGYVSIPIQSETCELHPANEAGR
jgi:patatin-like phospholipase/acyl hydrolase